MFRFCTLLAVAVAMLMICVPCDTAEACPRVGVAAFSAPAAIVAPGVPFAFTAPAVVTPQAFIQPQFFSAAPVVAAPVFAPAAVVAPVVTPRFLLQTPRRLRVRF